MKAVKKEAMVTEAEAAAGLSALFSDEAVQERAIERIENELAVIRRGVGKIEEDVTVLRESERKKQLSAKSRK